MAKSHKRSLTSRGWIPDYHGAWAMVFVPIIVGIVMGGATLSHIPLFLLWIVGYFCYFSASKWVISRRNATFLPPVKVYAAASSVLGIATLWAEPQLLSWAPWFFVLITVTIILTVRRQERTIVARAITVLTGVLMGCVSYDVGTHFLRSSFPWLPLPVDTAMAALPGHNWEGTLTGWRWMWLVSLILLLYFWGTILVVKTVIRARHSTPHLIFSLVFHSIGVVLALVGALGHWTGWGLFIVSVLLLSRSAYFPLSMRLCGKKWSATVIGITEIVFTAAVTLTIFLP